MIKSISLRSLLLSVLILTVSFNVWSADVVGQADGLTLYPSPWNIRLYGLIPLADIIIGTIFLFSIFRYKLKFSSLDFALLIFTLYYALVGLIFNLFVSSGFRFFAWDLRFFLLLFLTYLSSKVLFQGKKYYILFYLISTTVLLYFDLFMVYINGILVIDTGRAFLPSIFSTLLICFLIPLHSKIKALVLLTVFFFASFLLNLSSLELGSFVISIFDFLVLFFLIWKSNTLPKFTFKQVFALKLCFLLSLGSLFYVPSVLSIFSNNISDFVGSKSRGIITRTTQLSASISTANSYCLTLIHGCGLGSTYQVSDTDLIDRFGKSRRQQNTSDKWLFVHNGTLSAPLLKLGLIGIFGLAFLLLKFFPSGIILPNSFNSFVFVLYGVALTLPNAIIFISDSRTAITSGLLMGFLASITPNFKRV